VNALPDEVNGAAVDVFTFAHMGVGAVYAAADLPFWLVTLLALGWELAEIPLKIAHPESFPHPAQDSAANAVGDVAAVLIGWTIVRAMQKGP
jgi:hypothetical protein